MATSSDSDAPIQEFSAKLLIDYSSIEKAYGERQPDFVCRTLSGEEIAFELTAVCSEEVAKLIARAVVGKEVSATYTVDPTERIVRQKMHKVYDTQLPVELVCYWDARVVSTEEMILEKIHRTANSGPNPFRRVWFHGENAVYLVFEVSA